MTTENLRCIVHLNSVNNEDCCPFTLRRWNTFQKTINLWISLQPLDNIVARCSHLLGVKFEQISEEDKTIGYHPTCYCRFIDKKRIESARKRPSPPVNTNFENNQNEVVPASPKRLRSEFSFSQSVDSNPRTRVLPAVCILCRSEVRYITAFHKRQKDTLLKAATKTGGKLSRAAQLKNDERVLVHLRETDCVAAEIRYHISCYKKYTRFLQDADAPYACNENEGSSQLKAYQSFCSDVIEGRIIQNEEILRMSDLTRLYMKYLHTVAGVLEEQGGPIRSDKLKYWLKRDYQQLKFYTPMKRNSSSFVYCDTVSTGTILDRSIDNPDIRLCESSDDEEEEFDHLEVNPCNDSTQSLYASSLILQQAISECPSLQCPWPPTSADLTIDACRSVVPDQLYNFLAWTINASSDPKLSQKVTVGDPDTDRKLLSICQDIIYLSSKGRKQTPKSLGLGMAIRHLTGSSKVVQILNHFGHCASEDTVLGFDSSLAELQMTLGIHHIPSGFQKDMPTILVWDNIDFREETPSGHGTTHHTNGILIQTGESCVSNTGSRPTLKKGKRHFQAETEQLETYIRKKKQGPQAMVTQTDCGLDQHLDLMGRGKRMDLAFVSIKHFAESDTNCPGWTGFNTLLHTCNGFMKEKSNIHYLPVIQASPTELSTVNTILKRSCSIADHLNLEHVVVVFDESIYAKAQEIRWSCPDYMTQLVVRLGEFHLCMSFMGIIGKRFKDAGLRDILIESGAVAEGSVSKVLDGHHYNRSVRAHKLLYESLQRLRISAFLETLPVEMNEEATNCFKDIVCSFDQNRIPQVCDSLRYRSLVSLYDAFIKAKCHSDPTFALWSSYVDLVQLLLLFIRATRESDWTLHLATVRKMMPWFFSYNHVNYARYLPAYWLEMENLPQSHPECHQNMLDGNWTVQRQNKHGFSSIACDQAIEQTCNRDSKTKGGITGLTRHPGAVQR